MSILSTMFSFRSFLVSDLAFSLILCLQFPSFPNTIYWRGFFPIVYSYLHYRFIVHKHVDLFLGSLFCSIDLCAFFFVPLPCCFDYDITVQSLSHVWLFVTPWTAAGQTSLSFTISWSLLKLMFIEWVMSSNHLILYHPLLLLPSILPSIRVFFNKPALCIRWSKY